MINELDPEALRLKFRRLYQHHGYEECMRALYEIYKAAELLSEVIIEERNLESE